MLCAATILLLASVVSGTPTPSNKTLSMCGTNISSEKVLQNEAHFTSNLIQRPDNISADNLNTPALANVPVYFHIITSDGTVNGGNIPDSVLSTQINVLNANYFGTGLSFIFAGVTRTQAPAWYNIVQGSATQLQMKQNFRSVSQGPAALHVYTVGSIDSSVGSLAGYATFPADYAANPIDDGVVLDFHTLPFGAPTGYNLGKILTHEVGHWVGLYHTFQGGCFGLGDYVDDTPAEASPASDTGLSCPVGRDSCPSLGLDPITNYMDYTDNNCMIQFTVGQAARLADQIRTYRGIFI